MNFALVGIGKWGQTIIRTIQQVEASKLVATCSRSASQLPSELRIAPHIQSLDELLNLREVDTLIIATHPNSHFEIASKALWYGKNVICEKPYMFSKQETRCIKDLLEHSIFFTDYINLYHDVIDQMYTFLNTYGPRFCLKLVNSGCGPVRVGYSDLWDYGAHVASVIFSLFPDESFYDIRFRLNKEGNHVLTMSSYYVDVEAVFGNKSLKRQHSFLLTANCGQQIYWENDRIENPLKKMLQKFALGQVQTNISLSERVYDLLRTAENKYYVNSYRT